MVPGGDTMREDGLMDNGQPGECLLLDVHLVRRDSRDGEGFFYLFPDPEDCRHGVHSN